MSRKSYFNRRDSITDKIQNGFANSISQRMIIEKIKSIPMDKLFKEPVSEARRQTITFITTAFSLTAALFWNDAIKAMITSYIPKEGAWPYLFAAAVAVTIIAVIATSLLSKTISVK